MAEVILKHVKKIYPVASRKEREFEETESNLHVTNEGVVAVEDFDMTIADREFIVLVGPSGCGKSTTLNMIAGLESITSGELYIDGVLMNNVEPQHRDIAMVFQSYALYPHMTVYENMSFSLKLKKVPKDEIDRRVKEAAEILDITQYLNRKPKDLSGGQRQRVAIGRAIVRHPKVFLMDEPLSNLDAKLRNQMRAEIISLRHRIDTTFVYVTHDQTEAMTLGDRIVIMKEGVVQQIGTSQEVFEKPVNTFVAGFIGTPQMNFFNGELKREGDSYSIKTEGVEIALSSDKCERLIKNNIGSQKITIGVRPEHISLCDEGINSKVEVSEMLGSTIHVHVSTDGNEKVILVIQTMDLNEPTKMFASGKPVTFTFNPKLVHLFDSETGHNLEY
jgi:multiple sugar transport system ATP-binding protein